MIHVRNCLAIILIMGGKWCCKRKKRLIFMFAFKIVRSGAAMEVKITVDIFRKESLCTYL